MNKIYLPQLQVFSCYSILLSTLKLEDLINHAIKHKHSVVVLADWEKMYGIMEFYDLAKKVKIKPIFGLQFSWNNAHYLVLAKNQRGYNNLVKISSKISLKEEINKDNFENLFTILISGDNNVNIPNLYFANDSKNFNGIYVRESRFLNSEDFKSYCALRAINNNTFLEDEINLNQNLINTFLNQEDFVDENSILVTNLYKILNEIENFEPTKQNLILEFPILHCDGQKINSNYYLENLASIGLKKHRFHNNNVPLHYQKRLRYELDIIKQMNFADYFLIVQDFIREAKKRGIMVGPGRGSVAGSLVAYAIGITNIDPLVHNLYFERFLNPERQDMPDIDTDFMDTRRDEIVQYLYEKYGYKKIAQIITFHRIKARTAIRDIGRILQIPLKKIDYISKQIPLDFTEDLITFCQKHVNLKDELTTYPNLFELSNNILNLPRQIGIHAAGLVLSRELLGENFPIMHHENNYILTQYSMEYLERLGLIKMDLLGLRNLTFISEIIKLIQVQQKKDIIIESIPINDSMVYQDLANGKTCGIFQLESSGMTNLTRQFKPKCIEDISLISALYRPGPQKHIKHFLECRFNNKQIEILHPSLSSILNETYGIIVYQEQLIEVVKKVTNFSAARADVFRRVISKKEEEKLRNLENEFIDAGLKNNYQKDDLAKIWKYIYEFANYGFNHAHSISYSYISYWLTYLRHYYPLEFFAILLSSSGKIAEYVHEAQKYGIICCQPNLNFSSDKFKIYNKKIYFSFKTIMGFGDETVKNIVKAKTTLNKKQYDNYEEAIKQLIKYNVTINQTRTLVHVGAFDDLLNNKTRYWLDENLNQIYESFINIDENGNRFFQPNLKEVHLTKEIEEKYLNLEYQLLGVKFQNNIEDFSKVLKTDINLSNIKELSDGYYNLPILIQSFKQVKSKNNKLMAWVTLLDGHQLMDSIPYFGDEIHKLEFAKNNKKILVVKLEIKNSRIRIKEIY